MRTLIATFRVHPGKEAEFIDLVVQQTIDARKEPGNIRYDLYRSVSDPSVFLMHEEFVDAAAQVAHSTSKKHAESAPKVRALLDGAPTVRYLDEVEQARA